LRFLVKCIINWLIFFRNRWTILTNNWRRQTNDRNYIVLRLFRQLDVAWRYRIIVLNFEKLHILIVQLGWRLRSNSFFLLDDKVL
jgi:hypothetical protein